MMTANEVATNPLNDAKVGDGATFTIYTDSKAGTIIARTEKTITWQQDTATLQNGVNSGESDALKFSPGGFVGHTSGNQRYEYEPNPEGQILKFSRRDLRNGGHVWKLCKHPTRSPGNSLSAGRHEHYDYNF